MSRARVHWQWAGARFCLNHESVVSRWHLVQKRRGSTRVAADRPLCRLPPAACRLLFAVPLQHLESKTAGRLRGRGGASHGHLLLRERGVKACISRVARGERAVALLLLPWFG